MKKDRTLPKRLNVCLGVENGRKDRARFCIHALSDVYSAEKQLTKALLKLARAFTNSDVKAAFETHLEETNGQVARID